MKKLALLFCIVLFATISIAQDYTFGVKNATDPQTVITPSVLTSAGADTVDIELKRIGWKTCNYGLQITAVENSGTGEGYIDLYKSNDLLFWELVATRVSDDTLKTGNWEAYRADTTGFDARYLRLIITNKSQTMNVTYNSYLYIWSNQ